MIDTLAQIIFGWPAIIASLTSTVVGFVWKRPWLLAAGAVLIAPFSFYFGRLSAVRTPAIGLPGLQAGAAYALQRGKIPLALILVSPIFIVAVWLAVVVLTQ